MVALYKKFLASFLVLASVVSYSTFAGSSPAIIWNQQKIETQVFSGGVRNIEVLFTGDMNLENVEFVVAPPLQPFISIEPNNFDFIQAGEENNINIVISPELDTPLKKFSGVIQVKGAESPNILLSSIRGLFSRPQKQRIFAKPLLIQFETISTEPALELFEEFLLEEYGTLTPPDDSIGDVTEPISLPEDIIEAFAEGTDGALILEVGSVKLLGTLLSFPNFQAEEGLANLLTELDASGINVNDFRNSLGDFLRGHNLYVEGTSAVRGLLLTPGRDAVIFLPKSNFFESPSTTPYDEDGDGLIDHYVVVIDNNTHVIHREDHIESIKNNDFFDSEGGLNSAATTMLHELLHAMIFRTDCFEGTIAHEEDFASEFENIVSLRVQESGAYNSLFADFKENYPEGEDCINRLGLDFISSEESPWPQFQHDSRHTGQSEFQGPQTNNIKWRYPNTDAISVSTPVVGPNDVIYFGMKDENATDRLIALNPDGSLRFKSTELNSPMSSPAVISNGVVMVVTGAGNQIVAFEDKQDPNNEQPPLWSESVDSNISNMVLSTDGTLYFVTPALFLHSYTPTHEGITENWSRVLAQGTSARGIPTLGVGESGNIYLLRTVGFVPPRTRIYIINPEDGSNARSPITVSGQPPASSLLVLEDDTLVLGLPGLLRAIDPVTGTGTSVFVPSGINTVPILLPDGNIAIGVKEGPVFPLSASGNAVVHKIDLNLDNEDPPVILHTIQLGTTIGLGSPVVDSDSTIYITKRTDSGLNPDSSTLFAINPDNTIKFTKNASNFSGSLALGSNGTLYSAVIEFTNTLVANLWAVGE